MAGALGSKRESAMQIQITVEPQQENCHELAEVLRAFAKDYETWMIRSIKSGRHTLHNEAGERIAFAWKLSSRFRRSHIFSPWRSAHLSTEKLRN